MTNVLQISKNRKRNRVITKVTAESIWDSDPELLLELRERKLGL
jgi:hypothetical protein